MTNEEKILEMLTQMQGDIAQMQEDITEMRGDITEMRGDITRMQGDITRMQGDIESIKETQEEHSTALSALIEWTEEAAITIRVPFAKSQPQE